jgi:hypothetical protein
MEGLKKGGKVPKKKAAPKKVVKKVKITQAKGKQLGKVKTGAVVQIDLSRRTIARKERNAQKAKQLETTGILPYLMGFQATQVAAQSNIERLQNEKAALLAQARTAALNRVDAVREGQQLQANDAHERQRRAAAAERRIATELNVRQGEAPLSQLMGTQTEPEPETFRTEISQPERVLEEITKKPKIEEVVTSRKTQTERKKLVDTPTMEIFDKPSKQIEALQRRQKGLEEKIANIEKRRQILQERGTEGVPYDGGPSAVNAINSAFSSYRAAVEKLPKQIRDKYGLKLLKTPSLAKVTAKKKK